MTITTGACPTAGVRRLQVRLPYGMEYAGHGCLRYGWGTQATGAFHAGVQNR